MQPRRESLVPPQSRSDRVWHSRLGVSKKKMDQRKAPKWGRYTGMVVRRFFSRWRWTTSGGWGPARSERWPWRRRRRQRRRPLWWRWCRWRWRCVAFCATLRRRRRSGRPTPPTPCWTAPPCGQSRWWRSRRPWPTSAASESTWWRRHIPRRRRRLHPRRHRCRWRWRPTTPTPRRPFAAPFGAATRGTTPASPAVTAGAPPCPATPTSSSQSLCPGPAARSWPASAAPTPNSPAPPVATWPATASAPPQIFVSNFPKLLDSLGFIVTVLGFIRVSRFPLRRSIDSNFDWYLILCFFYS